MRSALACWALLALLLPTYSRQVEHENSCRSRPRLDLARETLRRRRYETIRAWLVAKYLSLMATPSSWGR